MSVPRWRAPARVSAMGITIILLAAPLPVRVQESGTPRRIDIVARRFAFEPAEIEVRSGERIELLVRSADGVHGIEIRQLRVNRRIPRGDDVVRIEFTAPAPGTYPILCSEYCGADHEDMKGRLVVRAADAPPSTKEP